jgi:hypothetical protein
MTDPGRRVGAFGGAIRASLAAAAVALMLLAAGAAASTSGAKRTVRAAQAGTIGFSHAVVVDQQRTRL